MFYQATKFLRGRSAIYSGHWPTERPGTKRLARKNVLSEFTDNVALIIFTGEKDTRCAGGAVTIDLGAPDLLGTLPNNLGEVASCLREITTTIAVLRTLVVPRFDGGFGTAIPSGQVLSVLASRVLKDTGGRDSMGEVGHGIVPLQGTSSM